MPHKEEEQPQQPQGPPVQPGQPQQLRRGCRYLQLARRALKLSLDSAGIHQAMNDNPEDTSRWGVLHDSFLDSGHEGMAALTKRISNSRTDRRVGVVQDDRAKAYQSSYGTRVGRYARGEVDGVPIGVWHYYPAQPSDMSNGFPVPPTPMPEAIGAEVHTPGPGGSLIMGRAILDPHEAAALLREMTPWSAHQQDHAHLLNVADRLAGHDQPAARLRRIGKKLRLGRLTRADIAPFTNAFAANPQDDAPHLIFADFLADHGDPREELVRQQVARGRQKFGEGRFVHMPDPSPTGGHYDSRYLVSGSANSGEGGFLAFTPHYTAPQVKVTWVPWSTEHHASSQYQGVLSPEHAYEVAKNAGMHPYMARWPEHAKPKNLPEGVDRTEPGA